MIYAKELTKEYLQNIGITNISEDGHIFKGNKEIPQTDHADGYKRVNAYDGELYRVEYNLTKNRSAGTIVFCVHRAVYAWFHGKVGAHMVVDHIDNNKSNNHISNLQLLTPGDNIWKGRKHNVWLLKCKLDLPRSFYETKLAYYTDLYETAKLNSDSDRVHKLRANLAQTKARLRYWDKYHKEDNEH